MGYGFFFGGDPRKFYPTRPMQVRELDTIVGWLNSNVRVDEGRTYGGGLVKFEPKEAMRIRVPKDSPGFVAAEEQEVA